MNHKTVGLTLMATILALTLVLVAGSPTLPLFDGAAYAQSAAPTLTAMVAPNNSATVSWTAVSGADSYELYRWEEGTGSWGNVIPVTGTSHTDSTVEAGKSYFYIVRAMTGGTAGDWSNIPKVTIPVGTVAPTGKPTLTATVDGLTAIDLAWTAVSGATSYDLWRWKSGASSWERIGGDLGGSTHADSGLTPGKQYWYVIRAVNAGGNGPWSSEDGAGYATATLPATLSAPTVVPTATLRANSVAPTPTPTARAAAKNDELTLTGGPIADQELVQGATSLSSTAFPIAAGGNGAVTYSVANLPAGITLNADRKLSGTASVAAMGKSRFTYTATDSNPQIPNTASLTFNLSVPPSSTTLTVAVDNTGIQLSWAALAGVDGWEYMWHPDSIWKPIANSNAGTAGTKLTAFAEGNYTFQVRAVVGSGDAKVIGLESNAITKWIRGKPWLDGTISDQVYVQDENIVSRANFPKAIPYTGGSSASLKYSVSPAVPDGLGVFTLSMNLGGTPTTPMVKTRYTFHVRDKWSTNFANFPFTISVKPKKPGGFTATAASSTTVTLSWTAIAGVEGWEYSKDDGGTWDPVPNSSETTATYTVTNLTTVTPYTFKVRATVGTGVAKVEGVESDADTAMTT